MRLICVCVPAFSLVARQRLDPAFGERPVVILDGLGTAAKVVAVSRAALAIGVRPGQSLPQARAISPRLRHEVRDGDVEGAAQNALLELAERFSPRIEDARPGVVYLDAEHCRDEKGVCSALLRSCEKFGFPAKVGLAACRVPVR